MNKLKQADDIVEQTWIIQCLKLFKKSDNVIAFISKAMYEYLRYSLTLKSYEEYDTFYLFREIQFSVDKNVKQTY